MKWICIILAVCTVVFALRNGPGIALNWESYLDEMHDFSDTYFNPIEDLAIIWTYDYASEKIDGMDNWFVSTTFGNITTRMLVNLFAKIIDTLSLFANAMVSGVRLIDVITPWEHFINIGDDIYKWTDNDYEWTEHNWQEETPDYWVPGVGNGNGGSGHRGGR